MVIKMKGDDCPMLFDKWKPDEFVDFHGDDKSQTSLNYDFPFTRVNIESSSIYSPIHLISGSSDVPADNFDWDVLFDKRVVEMYGDAKAHVKKKLEQMAVALPEVGLIDVEKHSIFQRVTAFGIDVGCDKVTGGFENVDERNRIIFDLYTSLEKTLMEKYGIVDQKVADNYHMGMASLKGGHAKLTDLANGVYIISVGPVDEVDAGCMKINIATDENGVMESHRDVYDYCRDFIRENKSGLQAYGGDSDSVFTSVSNNGVAWKVDLSEVRLSRKLPGGFERKLLTDNE